MAVLALKKWGVHGLKNLYFFIHQNIEESSPLISAYFIEKFNKRFSTQIAIPKTLYNVETQNFNHQRCCYSPSEEKKYKILLIKRKNEPFKGEWALSGEFLEEDELLIVTPISI